MDCMAGGVGKVLMDGQGVEFKDGTLDSEGNVDVKIAADGKVGIGVADPDSRLEIKGVGGTDGLTFKTTDNVGNNCFWVKDGGQVGLHYYPFKINQDNTDTDCPSGTFMYVHHASSPFIIKSDGNVGIGTAAPSADLEVSTASGGEFLVTRSGNSGVTLQQVNGGDATSGSLSIKGGTSMNLFTGGVNRLVIDATGNVSLPADGASLKLGASADLQMWHGSDGHSYISNTTGAFWIKSTVMDGNLIFAADRGDGGGTFDYFVLDGGSATYSGGTTAAYTKWQDNSRIALGTGKDLQLYHDGSNSYIKDTGTGSLFIQGSDIFIKTNASENAITAAANGAVNLYYDNALKLATTSSGINVTGGLLSATSSNIQLNNGYSLKWESSGATKITGGAASAYLAFDVNSGEKVRILSDGNVGIGITNPSTKLHVYGTSSHTYLKIETSTTNQAALQLKTGTANANWVMYTDTSTNLKFYRGGDRMIIGASGAIQFNTYGSGTHTGTAEYKLSVDSSGNVIETAIGAGAVDGSGTANYVTKWTDGDTIGNSILQDLGYLYEVYSENNSGTWWTDGSSGLVIHNTNTTVGAGPSLKLRGADARITWGEGGSSDTLTFSSRESEGTARETITFDNNGKVGIGNMTPGYRIDVVDQNPTDGIIGRLYNISASGLTGSKLWFAQNTVANWNIGQPAGTNAFVICNSTGSASERMRIDSSGNVGIGTTLPRQSLQVGAIDTANDGVRVTNAGSLNNKSVLGFGGSHIQPMAAVGGVVENAVGFTAGGLYFSTRTATSDTVPTERMRIASDGKVGIGTTAPSQLLHVKKSSNDARILIETTGAGAYLQLNSVTSGYAGIEIYGNSGANWSFGQYGFSDLSVIEGGMNGTRRVTFRAGGNVGIGTTAPSTKFQVHSGDILITSGKQLISTNSYTQAPGGMLTIQGPSTGNTTLSSNQWGIVIGPQHTRSSTAGTYYPGIAFNHLLNNSGGTSYNNAPQAWIGTRLYDTPGSERDSLVFATKSGTGVAASDVPIERMCINPFGNVGIGTTAPGANIETYCSSGGVIALRLNTNFGGGNAVDINPYISGVSNGGFSIKVGSVTPFVISAAHNVGIGTNAPANTLHVNGQTRLGSWAKIMHTGDSTQAGYIGSGADLAFGDSNDLCLRGTDSIKFTTNDGQSDAMTIDVNGKVGIGTTAPSSLLDVRGALGANGSVATPTAYFTNSTTGATSGVIYIGSTSGTDWKIGKNVTGISGNTNFSISDHSNNRYFDIQSSTGNVGIGTTAPEAPLVVAGSGGNEAVFRSNQATATERAGGGFSSLGSATAASRYARLFLDADGANFGGTDYFAIEKFGNSGEVKLLQYSNANMSFWVNTSTQAMTIKNDGDVGIGATPVNNYRLEVYDGDYTQMMLRAPTYPMLRFKADQPK